VLTKRAVQKQNPFVGSLSSFVTLLSLFFPFSVLVKYTAVPRYKKKKKIKKNFSGKYFIFIFVICI